MAFNNMVFRIINVSMNENKYKELEIAKINGFEENLI